MREKISKPEWNNLVTPEVIHRKMVTSVVLLLDLGFLLEENYGLQVPRVRSEAQICTRQPRNVACPDDKLLEAFFSRKNVRGTCQGKEPPVPAGTQECLSAGTEQIPNPR